MGSVFRKHEFVEELIMISYSVMSVNDYEGVYSLWINTPGMGLNTTDDNREGIEKYLLRNSKNLFCGGR